MKELMTMTAVKTLLIIVLAADFFNTQNSFTMNKPTYKIHGTKRRALKNELSKLKSFVKNYWHYYNLDNDMYRFYECQNPNLPTKEQAQKQLDAAGLKIVEIESRLSVLYQD